MNAEYAVEGQAPVLFTVQPQADGTPPRTAKLSSRSTCGKWITEQLFVLQHYDAQRDVAVYELIGTGKRPVIN